MVDEKRHTSFTMTQEEYEKIECFLSGKETVSVFCYRAMQEKIKRMEVRYRQARKQLHEKDVEIFQPIITDVLKMHNLI